jgi:methylated-DNA-[protein]-cysteine S-methyltransferase
MKFRFATLRTAFGPFTYAVDPDDAVVATAFGDKAAVHARLKFPVSLIADDRAAPLVRAQLEEYFGGARRRFALPLAAAGTPFQHDVWSELQRVPWGETRAYGEIAAGLGRPSAARAVGRANATNPICVIVPCHRVIGADGSLTGFAFGEEIKRRLLHLEGAPWSAPA